MADRIHVDQEQLIVLQQDVPDMIISVEHVRVFRHCGKEPVKLFRKLRFKIVFQKG